MRRLLAVVATVLVVVACAPSASPSVGASSSPIIRTLVATVDRGAFPVAGPVSDARGTLSDARPATAAELTSQIDRQPMEGSAGGVFPVPGVDRTALVVWGGSGCDRLATISLSADGSVLTLEADRPPRPTCDAPAPIYRGVYLTFVDVIDPGSIDVEIR